MPKYELDLNDITPIVIPFDYQGTAYVLKEANGDAATKYQNHNVMHTKIKEDGKPQAMPGIVDSEPMLVGLCVFTKVEADKGPSGKPVGEELVRTWPYRLQNKLYLKAKEISEIGQKDTVESLQKEITEAQTKLAKLQAVKGDPVKNEPSGTTAGSA
jgi:hypothetical protein